MDPELAKEWDPNNNGDLTPYDVTPGSHKKVGWKCQLCSYEWETRIYVRTRSDCPECGNKKKGESFKRNRLAKKMAEGQKPITDFK